MTRTRMAAALASALLAPFPRAAARDVSFAEARAAAERLAPDVVLAERRAAVSGAGVAMAEALPNPTFTATTARQTARLGTTLSVPLLLFGQRSAAIGAARAEAETGRLDVDAIRREARWGATLAWADLWAAQERARLLDRAAADAARLLGVATDRFDAGSGARLDVVRSRAERARAAAEAEAARQVVAAAAARLAPWLGEEPGAELAASGAPGYPAEPASLESLRRLVPAHPELRRDQARLAAAGARLRSEQRQRWPTVAALLSVNFGDPTLLLPGPDVIGGLSFDLPLLDQRAGAIERARADQSLAAAEAAADERRLGAELLDAYRRTEGAGAALRALREEVLPAIREAEAMTEDGYRSGRVDLVRLLEAERALVESRLSEAEAVAAWTRAAADLERAAGADLGGGAGAP